MTLFQAFGQFAGQAAAVSVDGMVLLTPSAVTVGSGSASIGTNGVVTVTGAASYVQIEGVFSATYDSYFFNMQLNTAANRWLRLRMVSGSTPATASNYSTQSIQAVDAQIDMALYTSNNYAYFGGFEDTGGGGVAQMWMHRPYNADETTYGGTSGSRHADTSIVLHTGAHELSTSYDGVYLTGEGSNIDSGKIAIYGLVK